MAEPVDTGLIEGTVTVCSATNNAFLFEANALKTAIIILSTFGWHFSTFDIRIATETTGARANGNMVRRHASRSSSTSTADCTSVYTTALDTSLLGLTVSRSSATRNTALVSTNLATGAVVIHGAFRRGLNLFAK